MGRACGLVIAHRGVVGPALENSLGAIRAAIDLGADWVELDVRRVATGELVLHHDALAGAHPLASLNRDQVAALTGRPPPLLEEALRLGAGRIGFDLEIKERGCAAEVAEMIKAEGDNCRAVVTSFLPDEVMAFASAAPQAPRGLLAGGWPPSLRSRDLIQEARDCGSTHLGIGRWQARQSLLEAAASAGLEAIVWTVDRPEALRRFLGNAAVLGVVTNRARLALDVRREVELRL